MSENDPLACPNCGDRNSRISESWDMSRGYYRRRRVCPSCGASWATMEIVATVGTNGGLVPRVVPEEWTG